MKILLFTLIISTCWLSHVPQSAMAEISQDNVICKKTIKLYSDNILAFEKYCEKYRMWQTPVLIVKYGPTIHLDEPENRDVYYYGDFAPSYSRKYIFMCRYYTTLDYTILDSSESSNEILKFSHGIIIDTQTGKELMNLYEGDVAGEWNCDDEWVSGDQILFSPFSAQQ